MADERRSARFEAREATELRRETLVEPWPELGLVAADGPADPEPELVVEHGVVVRLDGKDASELDVIDRFLVAHGLDLEVAAEAMALPDERLARMLVDVDVPRDELVRLGRGLTPAKLARVPPGTESTSATHEIEPFWTPCAPAARTTETQRASR
jgi:propanediol dehydratase large subunit